MSDEPRLPSSLTGLENFSLSRTRTRSPQAGFLDADSFFNLPVFRPDVRIGQAMHDHHMAPDAVDEPAGRGIGVFLGNSSGVPPIISSE
jgi:hypothetical protein